MTTHLTAQAGQWAPNCDGMLTRNPQPHPVPRFAVDAMDFPPALVRRFNAVHEAGHLALFLAMGVPVISAQVLDEPERMPGGHLSAASVTLGEADGLNPHQWFAALAAGERAADRWLREACLWTPARGWAVERGAYGDRQRIASDMRQFCGRTLTYGRSVEWTDYDEISADADHALNAVWPRVLLLADALEAEGQITGRQAREISGITPDLFEEEES